MTLELLNLFVLDLDSVNEHLMVLILIEFAAPTLHNRELRLLHFNDTGGMALLHLNLSLAQVMILIHIVLILTFEVGKLLVELLQGHG